MEKKESAQATLRQVQKRMRWQYSAKEKVQLIFKEFAGHWSIAEICQKEGINQTMYCLWRKEFLDAGGAKLIGDHWEFDKVDPTDLVRLNQQLKEIISKMAAKEKYLDN